MIRIKCKKGTFRRGGVRHTEEWADYPDDRFTADEIAVLQGESKLIVEVLQDKPDEAKTRAQLLEDLSKYQPVEMLEKETKANLLEMLKAHREAEKSQGA
ncbi:MAG: hypothetical protein JW884_14235 [Deltaproteobacteria bacterium]|nr:hypothetical protein [Deltaproteobacteria bacterium]